MRTVLQVLFMLLVVLWANNVNANNNDRFARTDTNYQPLENQRLSTTNSPTFAGDTIRNTTPTLVLQTSSDSNKAILSRGATANTLQLQNSVLQVGSVGKSLVLNGGYATASDAGLPSGTSAWSVSFWMKTDSLPPAGANALYHTIFSWGGTSSSTVAYISYNRNNQFVINWTASGVFNSGITINDSAWHHVVVVNNGTTITLYVDNTLKGSASGDVTSVTLSGSLFIGASCFSNVHLVNYPGQLDQLLFYNTALTSTNVSTLYNSGAGTTAPPATGNLIRRYDFEEGTGTSLVESSGVSGGPYNGTLFNSVSWNAGGKVPFSVSSSLATVINSSDGIINGEKGQHTFGDFNGGSVIQGKAIRFLQNNVYPLWSDDSGRISIDNANTGTYPALTNNFSVKGSAYFNGKVGIGTSSPTEALSVNGNIRAKQLTIVQTGWPDYVFDSAYQLQPLTQVAGYIRDNKHLPGVPSAKAIADSGLNVGDNQSALLKKIEELTLYIIDQDRKQQQVKQLVDSQYKLLQQQQQLLLQMQAQLDKLQQNQK